MDADPRREEPKQAAVSEDASPESPAPTGSDRFPVDDRAAGRVQDAAGETAPPPEGACAGDLERLSRASERIAAVSGWVEAYPDEASALAALRREVASPAAVSRQSGSVSGAPVGEADDSSGAAGSEDVSRRIADFPDQPPPARRAGVESVGVAGSPACERDPGEGRGVPHGMRGAADRRDPLIEPTAQGSRNMDKRIGSEISDLDRRSTDGAVSAESGRGPLEAELRRAQEELRRMREQRANRGRIPERLPLAGDRQDARTADLREKFSRAQAALDARAERIRSELNAERQRLRAYREKLRVKSRELIEATRVQKARLIEQRTALRDRAAELAAREAELEAARGAWKEASRTGSARPVEARLHAQEEETRRLRSELAEAEARLRAREADLERETEARVGQGERSLVERTAALEAREKALADALAEFDRQRESFEQRRHEEEAALAGRRAELEEEHASRRQQWMEAAEAETRRWKAAAEEEMRRREADLEAARARLAALETALEEQTEALELRDQALTGREGVLTERDRDLADRADRLKEWESRLQAAEEDLAARSGALRREQEESQRLVRENRELAASLEARSESLREAQAALEADRHELGEVRSATEDRLAELENREAALRARAEEIETLVRETEARAARLKEDESQYEALQSRADALEREAAELASRQAEVFRREEALAQREAASEHERAALASAREDLAAIREQVEQREEAIARREREFNERVTRAAEIEHGARQVETGLRDEREELDALRASYERDVAALETWREELAREREALDEQKLALRLDGEKHAEEAQAIETGRAELEQARRQLAVREEDLAEGRARIEQQQEELARRRADLEQKREELEAARARCDRDQLSLRDRERMLEEERARIDAVRLETEEARRRLAERIHETRDLRRKLAGKIRRHRGRKARLARDAAELEERRSRLDAGLAEIERARGEIQRDREELARDRATLEEGRQALEADREALEQARRTFEAGLRQLEDDRRDIGDREAALAERAEQLEAYRDRLEEEYGALQAHREELLAAPGEDAASSERLASALKQAEQETERLRERSASLETHEAAVAARESELARAEGEIDRRRQELEERARQLESELASLEGRRAAVDTEIAAAWEQLEARRREAEAAVEARREQLRERERESEQALVRRREELENDFLERERVNREALREKTEAECAERLEAIARQEQEVAARCEARWEEVERDIHQRLERLEEEIKERRQRAEAELSERERAFEEEMSAARTAVDTRIEDLRRRRSVLVEDADARAADVETDVYEAVEEEPSESEFAEAGAFDAGTVDLAEDFGSDFEVVEDEAPRPGDGDRPAPAEEHVPASRPEAGHRKTHADVAAPAPRRFRPVITPLCALLLGAVAAGFYMWSPDGGERVRGRLVLNTENPGTRMSCLEVQGDLIGNEAVFASASKEAGADLARLVEDGAIRIIPARSGDAVELTARVSGPARRAARQGWIDALGRAYVQSLTHREMSEAGRRQALAEAERELAAKRTEWRQAAAALGESESAFEAAFPAQALVETPAEQARLKEAAEAARAEAEAARQALEAFPRQAPSGPIVPSEAEVLASMSSDEELVQAMAERSTRARGFHRVLTAAMSQAQTPLTTLLSSIDAFSEEVARQIEIQTDIDIRRELESVAVGLADYADQARAYSERWDELAPKVASWTPEDEADLLLEYQRQAELLVREFYEQSRKSFGEVARQADQIGRGGGEMTQRRIVHNVLQKRSHAAHNARNEWILAVDGMVPANNPELKALRDTLKNLAQRIERGRSIHRAAVAEKRAARRTADWAAERERLKAELEAAEARHRDLSQRALAAMASTIESDRSVMREMEARRAELDRQREKVARLKLELTRHEARVDQLRSGAALSMAGAVNYEPLEPLVPSQFDAARRRPALALGLGVALVFTLLVWLLTRSTPPLAPARA